MRLSATSSLKTRLSTCAPLIAVAALSVASAAQAAGEVFIPVLSYRTGAYSPNGTPLANGFVDYLKLVNARDGGINGVKIAYEECEYGYATDRGIECFDRLKHRKPVAVWPSSTGLTFALTARAHEDKVPIFTPGYGRSDTEDGTVFPWNFPLIGTYYTAADILIQHVAKLERGNLKGRKIVLVYHDSPYGKEPIQVLEERAKKDGFELTTLPVTPPGVEQKSVWLQVRQRRPDYVLLWGWGVMNSTAIKEMAAAGFPRSKTFGVWWSAAEPDVQPAALSAVGYSGLTLQQSGEADLPVHREIAKHVHDKNQGTGRRDEIGTVLYNRGLQAAMLIIESIRTAQARFGKRPVTGEEVRWGAENLRIDKERITALGFGGQLQPIMTTCADHLGSSGARVHTWDGQKWKYASDWYQADRAFLKPLIEASSKRYAQAQKIVPRDCRNEK